MISCAKDLATPVPLSLDWLNLCLQAVRFNLELAAPSGTSICAPEDTPRWESNWVASAFQNCSWVQFNVNNLYLNLKRKSGPCQWQLPIESCPKICTMICPMICDCSYILVIRYVNKKTIYVTYEVHVFVKNPYIMYIMGLLTYVL